MRVIGIVNLVCGSNRFQCLVFLSQQLGLLEKYDLIALGETFNDFVHFVLVVRVVRKRSGIE